MTDVNDADIVVQYGAGVVEDDHIRAALTADGHYILIANHFLVKALGLNAPYNQIKQFHIDWLSLLCLDLPSDDVFNGYIHFAIRLRRFQHLLKDLITVGLGDGLRDGNVVEERLLTRSRQGS